MDHETLGMMDVICGGCKLRNTVMKIWKLNGLGMALAVINDKERREQLEKLLRERGYEELFPVLRKR